SGSGRPFNVLNLIAAHIQCTSHGVPRLLHIRQGGGSVRQTADSLVNILFRRGVGVVHRLADSSSSADRDIFNSQSASSISVHLLHIGKFSRPIFQVCHILGGLGLGGFQGGNFTILSALRSFQGGNFTILSAL